MGSAVRACRCPFFIFLNAQYNIFIVHDDNQEWLACLWRGRLSGVCLMKKISQILLFLIFISLAPVSALQFRYTYNKGDQYRFISRVYQEHGFEDGPLEKTQLVNRMTFKVADVKDGRGRLEGGQQTSQSMPGAEAALWSKEYPISFWRDAFGIYEVGESHFVPMVRNVPYFPKDRDFQPGERWFGRGEEVHDMSKQIGYPKPFRIPISVEHEYVGPVQKNGKNYHHIRVLYKYSQFIPKAFLAGAPKNQPAAQRLRGEFNQDIYWDEELGMPAFYKETYKIFLDFENRRTYVFKGEAEAELVEAKPMDKQKVEDDLRKKLEEKGLSDIKVTRSAKGVTLSIDNVQFVADSANILPGQDEKLKKIGEIVQGYPDRDIALVGHTASVSDNPDDGLPLSELRAKALADYLVKGGFRKAEGLIVEGRGGHEPLESNDTSWGRAKNRRVEITILEN